MFSISKSTSSTGDYRGPERDQEIPGRTGGVQRIAWRRAAHKAHCSPQRDRQHWSGDNSFACLSSLAGSGKGGRVESIGEDA